MSLKKEKKRKKNYVCKQWQLHNVCWSYWAIIVIRRFLTKRFRLSDLYIIIRYKILTNTERHMTFETCYDTWHHLQLNHLNARKEIYFSYVLHLKILSWVILKCGVKIVLPSGIKFKSAWNWFYWYWKCIFVELIMIIELNWTRNKF